MEETQKRAPYQAPKLEVQRLRELPSALAQSSTCHDRDGCKHGELNGLPGGLPDHILGGH